MIELPYHVVRESFTTLLLVGSPMFLAVLVVGLVVGALQSATQINDPALSFVPRLIALIGAISFGGSWIIDTLAAFFRQSVERF